MAIEPVYILNQPRQSEIVGLKAHVDLWTNVNISKRVETSDHPRERDTSFVDHAVESPLRISMSGFVSDVLTAGKRPVTHGRLVSAVEALEAIIEAKAPVDVVTIHGTYRDMLPSSLDRREGPGSGYSVEFDMSFKHIPFYDAERGEVATGYVDTRGRVDPVDGPDTSGPRRKQIIQLRNVVHQTFSMSLTASLGPLNFAVKWNNGIGEWGLEISRGAGDYVFVSPPWLRIGEVGRLMTVGGEAAGSLVVEPIRGDLITESPPAPSVNQDSPWGYSHQLFFQAA